jgi:hypothetical protein
MIEKRVGGALKQHVSQLNIGFEEEKLSAHVDQARVGQAVLRQPRAHGCRHLHGQRASQRRHNGARWKAWQSAGARENTHLAPPLGDGGGFGVVKTTHDQVVRDVCRGELRGWDEVQGKAGGGAAAHEARLGIEMREKRFGIIG